LTKSPGIRGHEQFQQIRTIKRFARRSCLLLLGLTGGCDAWPGLRAPLGSTSRRG
jgi:hypothetical protein